MGMGLGARVIQQRLADPGLTPTELAFLSAFRPPPSASSPPTTRMPCSWRGPRGCSSTAQIEDASHMNELVELLERRVALLRMLRAALAAPGVYVRIGHENELPAMHSLALVATAYGMAPRKLGTVSLIGPVRMDYAGAIATVREAAQQLSRFVEDAYATN